MKTTSNHTSHCIVLALLTTLSTIIIGCSDTPTHYWIETYCDDRPTLKYVVRWDEVEGELQYYKRMGCSATSKPYTYQ
jgi:hypothetical protein